MAIVINKDSNANQHSDVVARIQHYNRVVEYLTNNIESILNKGIYVSELNDDTPVGYVRYENAVNHIHDAIYDNVGTYYSEYYQHEVYDIGIEMQYTTHIDHSTNDSEDTIYIVVTLEDNCIGGETVIELNCIWNLENAELCEDNNGFFFDRYTYDI